MTYERIPRVSDEVMPIMSDHLSSLRFRSTEEIIPRSVPKETDEEEEDHNIEWSNSDEETDNIGDDDGNE
ncbi:hypothetical protein JTB14_016177 [Gonioctena quinquepunctata]|nr:hypothetical protein JTB14_016177 [Gonioctena quinquepunctata]